MKYIGPIEFIQLNNLMYYIQFNLKDSKMKYIGPIKFINQITDCITLSLYNT